MKANELKPGMAINLDGKLLVCTRTEHVKPGKGPAYIQAKLKDIAQGGVTEKRFNSADILDGATLDRREMEFLFADGQGGGTFMDLETYDQVELGRDILDDALQYLSPNTQLIVLFYEGKPMTVELPASVELEVTETPPVVKGATATNQLKDAECETGLKTRVPPFITTGERIKVSTQDGSYLSRVKDS